MPIPSGSMNTPQRGFEPRSKAPQASRISSTLLRLNVFTLSALLNSLFHLIKPPFRARKYRTHPEIFRFFDPTFPSLFHEKTSLDPQSAESPGRRSLTTPKNRGSHPALFIWEKRHMIIHDTGKQTGKSSKTHLYSHRPCYGSSRFCLISHA